MTLIVGMRHSLQALPVSERIRIFVKPATQAIVHHGRRTAWTTALELDDRLSRDQYHHAGAAERTDSLKKAGSRNRCFHAAVWVSNPLLIDVDGVIIAGHGRLLAAKSIGMDPVPTITLPHLNEAQCRALRLADNKIALNAGWDRDLLRLELKDLGDLDINFDLSLTGFSTGEIDVLLASGNDPDDEAIPALPAQARTSVGDVWICGQHRVGCGDGRDLDFLRTVIGDDAKIDAAFLDPPYNVRINGHANERGRHREFAMASGEMTEEEFRGFLSEVLGACARVSRDGAVHFVCMDWRHMEDVGVVGRRVYGELLNLCIWNKSKCRDGLTLPFQA